MAIFQVYRLGGSVEWGEQWCLTMFRPGAACAQWNAGANLLVYFLHYTFLHSPHSQASTISATAYDLCLYICVRVECTCIRCMCFSLCIRNNVRRVSCHAKWWGLFGEVNLCGQPRGTEPKLLERIGPTWGKWALFPPILSVAATKYSHLWWVNVSL